MVLSTSDYVFLSLLKEIIVYVFAFGMLFLFSMYAINKLTKWRSKQPDTRYYKNKYGWFFRNDDE